MRKTGNINNIAVIGAGSWGTSIALIIAENNPQLTVVLWAFEKSVAASINGKRENISYLKGVLLPQNVVATASLKEAVINSNVILFATPSNVIYEIAQKINKYIKEDSHVGVLTKGFLKVHNEILTISQAIEKAIPKQKNKIVAIYGPSHAEEVVNRYHTCLNVAGKTKLPRNIFKKLLSNDFLQCRETDDIIGVELGGTLKNPAAIAAGMISVLPKCGDNLSGALISEALKEMLRLARFFNARDETIIDISGLGDLVATALSDHSRNRRFGKEISNQIIKRKKNLDLMDRLLLKFKPAEFLEKMSKKLNYLAEGAYAIEPLIELSEKNNIPIPVYRSLYEVLLNKKNPSLLIETIKNPEKFKQIYSETKIQISDKKKGLEKVKGRAYYNLIVKRTIEKLVNSNNIKNNNPDQVGKKIEDLKKFTENYSNIPGKKLKKIELKIINNITPENFSKSVSSLANIYVKGIVDNFNLIINWIFIKSIMISRIVNFFRGNKGKIDITGDFQKIQNIDKSANIIYVPTFKSFYDYIFITYSTKKLKLPFPRFFVNKDSILSTKDKIFIKMAGGFIVDPDKINNIVYKESLYQYISIMIEHGVPLMYFPELKPNENKKKIEIPCDFHQIIIDSLYDHTVEIVIIPIEIFYSDKSSNVNNKKISLLKKLNGKVHINYSDPIFLSDFTTESNPLKGITKIIIDTWVNDSVNNDFGVKIKDDELFQ